MIEPGKIPRLNGWLVRQFADIGGLKKSQERTMRTKPKKEFDLAEVERLASLGLTREQIAASLGASVSTIYGRLRDDEEFADAVKRGEAQGIGAVVWVLAYGGCRHCRREF